MKSKNHNPLDTPSEQGYKKRFLLRKVEEEESKKQIREFDDFDEPNRLDYPENDL